MIRLRHSVRLNRAVASCRVLLAGVALATIWLDPSQPSRLGETAYPVLTAYFVGAAAAWVLAMRARQPSGFLSFGTHVVDLIVFSMLVFLTEGVTSPFFVFFVFALLVATMHWHARGAYATGAVALIVLLILAVSGGYPAGEHASDRDILLVRASYVVVLAILFVNFGAQQKRQISEVSALIAPDPEGLPHESISRCLARAHSVFPGRRLALVYSDPEEPWIRVATLTDRGFDETREPPSFLGGEVLVPPVAFAVSDAARPTEVIVARDRDKYGALQIPDPLVRRFAIRGALAIPINGQLTEGVLLVLDFIGATSDDLLIGQVLGIHCSTTLDRMFLAEEMSRSAAAAERMRLARDLHDSVLQALTGARFRIQAVIRSLPPESRVRPQLAEISGALTAEFNSLRSYIAALSPGKSGSHAEPLEIGQAMASLARRLESEWGITVEALVSSSVAVSPETTREIALVVTEAVANAVRHGGAAAVAVDISVDDQKITLAMKDDGSGFRPFGSYTHEQLTALSVGSQSLRKRVSAMAGAISMHSSPAGVEIDVIIPNKTRVAAYAH